MATANVMQPLAPGGQNMYLSEHSPLLQSHSRDLRYGTVLFLSFNRSLNLVIHKIPIIFSWYLAHEFEMSYTLFAICALNIGSSINIPLQPLYLQYRIRYILVSFELLLAISIGAITEWHSVLGLFTLRLFSTFSIAAIRSSVNATISAFAVGVRRTRILRIMEWSFPLSAFGFIGIGAMYHYFGYRILFAISTTLIVAFALCAFCILPPWTSKHHRISSRVQRRSRKNSSVDSVQTVLSSHRMQLIAISVLLNKIGRSALYYTFSQWLSVEYGYGPLQTGYMTLCIIGGSLCGTVLIPKIFVRWKWKPDVHLAVQCSAILQIVAMAMEIIWSLICGHSDIPLWAVCLEIFCYFCGCQVFYSNIVGIMIAVAPSPKMLPAVNVILLISGSMGAIIGTVGSTVWYEWGGHLAVSIACAIVNVGCAGIGVLLWVVDRSRRARRAARRSLGGGTDGADPDDEEGGDVGIPVFRNDQSCGIQLLDAQNTENKTQQKPQLESIME